MTLYLVSADSRPFGQSFRSQTARLALLVVGLIFVAGLQSARSAAADVSEEILKSGEQIYRKSCLQCHGENGAGVEDHYADPLVGDATIDELADQITETMPEEDPDSCVGKDATAVAAYIHHAFYSEEAQSRNRPPRIRLARLTGEQLRNSLADLYASFDFPSFIDDTQGVRGHYFDDDNFNRKKRRIERTDPVIDFDFGVKSPGDKINAKEYAIQWVGSIRPDVTGRYEIVLKSTCSFMFYFGDDDRELFNNHVQSEGRDEFRRTVFLTAGRGYSFKLDLRKRKRKTKQPPVTVSMSWVPPGGVEEVIPTRFLSTKWQPATFALQAKLPADDRSYGYERGTSVDRQWDESTTRAAIEFSELVIAELWPKHKRRHRKDKNDNREVLREFLADLVGRAFRSPLDETQRKLYVDRHIDETPDDAEAIKKVCLVALKSPWFLYPSLDAAHSVSHRTANRLAYVLMDSLPSNHSLRNQANNGKLTNDPQLTRVAWGMLNDYRTHAKMRSFLYEWLGLAHADDLSKDQEKFPGFDQRVVADLRLSLNAFLDDIVWSDASDYRQLLTADWTHTNERLAKLYGENWNYADKNSSGMQRSVADSKRIGALSHPLVMAGHSYHKTTSPIHRGVFLYRKILGRTLRPPNAAFSPLNPDLHPKLTTRQRVELQTGEVNCQVCHSKINSLGFALESFDPIGRYRDKENGQAINAAGKYTTRAGDEVNFNGARELADFLVSSEDAHRAFVDSCFEYFAKQPINAYGSGTLERLTKSFQDSDFSMKELLVAIAVTVASEARDSTPTQNNPPK